MGDEERLDERARRRPGFRGGYPVRLLDGQDWTFARPRISIGPDDDDGFAVYAEAGDPRYGEAYDAYYRASEAEGEDTASGRELMRLAIRMGTILLQVNYDLSNREVARIMRFSWEEGADPEAFRVREEVMRIALGRGPKPPGAGPGSPP